MAILIVRQAATCGQEEGDRVRRLLVTQRRVDTDRIPEKSSYKFDLCSFTVCVYMRLKRWGCSANTAQEMVRASETTKRSAII